MSAKAAKISYTAQLLLSYYAIRRVRGIQFSLPG